MISPPTGSRRSLLRKALSKGRMWCDFFYKKITVRIYACDAQTISARAPDPTIARQNQISPGDAVYSAMKAAESWENPEMARRRRDGDVCYVVLEDGRCVHFSWLACRGRYNDEIGYEAVLDSKNYWIYDCHTVPSHRGRAVFQRVLKEILTDVKTAGTDFVWIDVLDTNSSSRAAVTAAGFTEAALLEKTTLFSAWVLRRRKIILHPRLGKNFDGLSFAWTGTA